MSWVVCVGFFWKPSITNTKHTGVLWTPFLRQRDGPTGTPNNLSEGKPFLYQHGVPEDLSNVFDFIPVPNDHTVQKDEEGAQDYNEGLFDDVLEVYITKKKASLGALHFHCFSQHGTETQTKMKGWNLICPRIENNFALLSHLGPFVISWRMR